jgi:hypothetical protein
MRDPLMNCHAANGNVFRIFWEMMVGETLVNWSVKLEEDPFKLGESILEK